MATLPSDSRSRRSRITRLCTLLPSLPANGELLTEKVIARVGGSIGLAGRSEEHTSELQSLMRNSYAVFCLKKKNKRYPHNTRLGNECKNDGLYDDKKHIDIYN